jgi:hypothetical protein
VDLSVLLDRDHDQLDQAIASLIDPGDDERRVALDTVRTAFAAHADAVANVLHGALAQVTIKHDLVMLIAQTLAEHHIQESILRRLDLCVRRADWVCAVVRLRRALADHGAHETATVVRTLRTTLPALDYQRLAQRYAMERLRALDMLAVVRPSPGSAIRAHRRATR